MTVQPCKVCEKPIDLDVVEMRKVADVDGRLICPCCAWSIARQWMASAGVNGLSNAARRPRRRNKAEALTDRLAELVDEASAIRTKRPVRGYGGPPTVERPTELPPPPTGSPPSKLRKTKKGGRQ